jgi:hypothetical protein
VSVKATLIDDDFTRLVRNLSRYTGTEFPRQMRQEAGLVALDCMRFTRPSGKGLSPRDGQKVKKAIARDVNRAVQEFWPERVRGEKLQSLVRSGNASQLESIVQGWRSKYKDYTFHAGTEENIERLHKQARSQGSRGRYRVRHKMKQFVLVPKRGTVRKYVDKVSKRVGSIKAAWIPALQKLGRGQQVKSWIRKAGRNSSKAMRAGGAMEFKGKDYAVQFHNSMPTITQSPIDIKSILKFRTKSMISRLRRILRAQGLGKAVI